MKKMASISLVFMLTLSIVAMHGFLSTSQANPSPIGLSINHGSIRSNGAVEPSTLPIQHVGNNYLLTGNIINYTIDIQKSNIVLDGAGFTIQGAYALEFDGLTLSNVNNVTIKNLKLNVFANGIVLNNTSNIAITNTRIDASTCVSLNGACASDISCNTLSAKGYSIIGQGNDNVINYNYIMGRAAWLKLSSGNRITNNYIKAPTGISLQLGDSNEPCNNNVISGNKIIVDDSSGVPSGIGIFYGSSNNQVFKNKITGCKQHFLNLQLQQQLL